MMPSSFANAEHSPRLLNSRITLVRNAGGWTFNLCYLFTGRGDGGMLRYSSASFSWQLWHPTMSEIGIPLRSVRLPLPQQPASVPLRNRVLFPRMLHRAMPPFGA
jgi:hypothetical protein